jgi:hypothetical protein
VCAHGRGRGEEDGARFFWVGGGSRVGNATGLQMRWATHNSMHLKVRWVAHHGVGGGVAIVNNAAGLQMRGPCATA